MKIQLKASCLINIPFQSYPNDFLFIVNGKEFRTTRLISDILSPKISKIHLNDPTFEKFTIKTQYNGDFSNILNLVNFEQNNFPISEIQFIKEVIKILENDSFNLIDPADSVEITKDNVFSLIKEHEKYPNLFSNKYSKEIDFISTEFYELIETKEEEFKKLQIDTLYKIINNKKLQIKTEDQLLNFINKLYSFDSKYSILYELVYFKNVTLNMMSVFFSNFNLNDITTPMWQKLSHCFQNNSKNKQIKTKRYKEQGINIIRKENEELTGIINYLRKQLKGEIEKKIKFTSSSVNSNSQCHQPENVANHEEQSKNFCSENLQSSWICFDFDKYRIVPTEYEIRSRNGVANWYHPKSWVIECSNDCVSWEILDERNDCSSLNGKRITCSFKLNNPAKKDFQYFRMRSTGPDWYGSNYLTIEAFEIYGKLI